LRAWGFRFSICPVESGRPFPVTARGQSSFFSQPITQLGPGKILLDRARKVEQEGGEDKSTLGNHSSSGFCQPGPYHPQIIRCAGPWAGTGFSARPIIHQDGGLTRLLGHHKCAGPLGMHPFDRHGMVRPPLCSPAPTPGPGSAASRQARPIPGPGCRKRFMLARLAGQETRSGPPGPAMMNGRTDPTAPA